VHDFFVFSISSSVVLFRILISFETMVSLVAVLSVSSIGLLLFAVFDVWYFVRAFVVVWRRRLFPTKQKFDHSYVSKHHTMVMPTDLDFLWHKNNARYAREADFARFRMIIDNGLWQATSKLKTPLVLTSTWLRFRKELRLFQVCQKPLNSEFATKPLIVCDSGTRLKLEQLATMTKHSLSNNGLSVTTDLCMPCCIAVSCWRHDATTRPQLT
jgi:hypothetical protein